MPLVLAVGCSFLITLILIPPLRSKMKEGRMVGRDINKFDRPEIPELGGIAAVFGFALGLSFVLGEEKLRGFVYETPILAAIGVFFIAGMIGLIDDVSDLSQRVKSVVVAFAALPLIIWHGFGDEESLVHNIALPFDRAVSFLPVGSTQYYMFWFILVPLAVTCVANAVNMSAGYNGLESGQMMVISVSLFVIMFAREPTAFFERKYPTSALILLSVIGCTAALYVYNRYPSKIFIGNIGTLGLGAVLGAAIIMSGLAFYAAIALLPAFYEAFATVYYRVKNVDRRPVCHNPIIRKDGRLAPPRKARFYTLAFLILSIRPMNEKNLVRAILVLYGCAGLIAIGLAVL
jgi:UDP-N-acetylglucosamine--dolichyl-phosphate N-acetylglucosaminephosphotransferase